MDKNTKEMVEGLKKSIEEMEYDKKTNKIKWVAKFHSKDDIEEKVITIGIRQERHLVNIYFDFDTADSDGAATSEEKALTQIKERWGYMHTFKWIKQEE